MSTKIWVPAVVAVLAAIGSVAMVHADSSNPPHASKLSPPVIHESFVGHQLSCSSSDQSTPGLEGCLERRILATDRTIDGLDKSIFSEMSKGVYERVSTTLVLHRFLASHRAWLAYRESDCANLWGGSEEGTIFPVLDANCTIARNRQRIQDLRAFMRYPEG